MSESEIHFNVCLSSIMRILYSGADTPSLLDRAVPTEASLLFYCQDKNTILSFVDIRQHKDQSLNSSSYRTPGVLPFISLTSALGPEGRASSNRHTRT